MRGLWVKTLGFVLVASSLAFGQITFDFTGGGARAKAMGNAYFGVSDDATAISWNPAGLTAFEKPVMAVSFGSFSPKGKYDDNGLVGSQRTALNGVTNQTGSFSSVSFLSFLSPIRIRGHQFIFSGAYTREAEDYQSVDMAFSALAPYYDQYGNPTEETYTYHLKGASTAHAFPYVVNLGFGTRLYKSIDFGLSANIYTGKSVSRQDYVTTVPDYIPLGVQGHQVVLSERTYSILDTAKFSGINFTFGFRGATEKLTYALVIKTGYSMRHKAGSTITDTTKYNGNVVSDQSKTIFVDDQLTKISIPWVFGTGGSYKAGKNLLLAADIEYRPYSGHKVKVRDSVYIKSGSNNEEVYYTVDPGWFSVVTMRAGAEYMWTTKSRIAPLVPIRAGLNYVPIPTPSYSVVSETSETSTSSASRLGLAIGTGVYWSQIHVDLSYTYSTMNRDVVWVLPKYIDRNYKIRGPLPIYSPAEVGYGQVKNRDHQFDLTLTGYF